MRALKLLWYRLVVWFGLRYDIWPWWWYDASDVTWTTVGEAWTNPDQSTFTVVLPWLDDFEWDNPEDRAAYFVRLRRHDLDS